MSLPSPSSDSAGPGRQQESDDVLLQFREELARLGRDSDFIVRSLTDELRRMPDVSAPKLSDNEARFLIESGAFTAEQLARTSAFVNRGGMQLAVLSGWLSALFETGPLDYVIDHLGWSEDDVRAAVSEGRLYAIEVSGQLRFPSWQFDIGAPDKLLPGLADVIAAVAPRWDWRSVAGFMATPQSDLIGVGRKTPRDWLRDGGAASDVTAIAEASDWR